jgi:polar amino acid transport system substrate-binding protein
MVYHAISHFFRPVFCKSINRQYRHKRWVVLQKFSGSLLLVIGVCSLFASLATFSYAQESGNQILRWGADAQGGAPFIFPDPEDPGRVIGFEVDFVNALSAQLNMQPVFVQNQWGGLVPGLQLDNYDIIVNGLEITEDRALEIDFSVPYFVTYEQLTVRKDTYDINSLQDCNGRVVATLRASLAERILESMPGIEIRSYDGQYEPYEDLQIERLDAVLMDQPIALYYGYHKKELKFVGPPISQMFYGIGIRKNEKELLHKINNAIHELNKNGTLRKIYERWNLWTPMMAEYFNDHEPSNTPPDKWQAYLRQIGQERTWKDQALQYLGYLPLLGKGAVTTVQLSVISMALAVLLGLLLALTRLYAPKPLSFLATAYIELMRGTPLLIQLYIIFYGLPKLGLQLTPYIAAISGLALNYAAYEAENYRAGILSIPRSQMEAALALGMTRLQALRHVVVPQAMRLVIPPVTNDFISLFKDSSLVSVITMVELTKVYGQLANINFDYIGLGLLTAAMYFLVGLPFVRLARMAEKRFSLDKRAPAMAAG